MSKAKLNQIIAVVTGKKSKAERYFTDLYQGMKPDRLSGIVRSYQPLDDEGEKFPSEQREVQMRIGEVLKKLTKELSAYYDVVATQEYGNTNAKSDIVMDDGMVLLKDVPVGALLFLDKQMIDLRTFVSKLPVLPTDRVWKLDKNRNCFVTEDERTNKTQKVPEVIIKYEATKEHPAQTELISLDRTIGHWSTTHFSGAIPVNEKEAMLDRVEKLQDAIKKAREQANSLEIDQKKIGETLLKFVLNA